MDVVSHLKKVFQNKKITPENVISNIEKMNKEASKFIKDKKERIETVKAAFKDLKNESIEFKDTLTNVIEVTIPDVIETVEDVWKRAQKICPCF